MSSLAALNASAWQCMHASNVSPCRCTTIAYVCICAVQESEVLAKAFKEHERRKGEREGFSYTPADALAFKYYRDVS